jgi:triacylglycerol lipase
MSAERELRACPVPLWAYALGALALEFAFWAWLTRYGVRQSWWGDLQGGLLLLALPFALRLLIALSSYALSRVKGVSITLAQRLSPWQWLRFFAAEYFYLCLQSFVLIPFRVFFHTATDAGRGPAAGPVIVLQHGFMHNGGVWFFTARALERRGYRVFAIDQPLFAPIDWMAERLHHTIERAVRQGGEGQITLIAHSMGGLVSRAYLRKFGDARVRRLISLGSPHHGTWHAQLAAGTNGGQMRHGNAWLAALNETAVTVPFVSMYSLHDTIISPQDSSRMPEAENVELYGIGHVAMPSGRAMRKHLLDVLAR